VYSEVALGLCAKADHVVEELQEVVNTCAVELVDIIPHNTIPYWTLQLSMMVRQEEQKNKWWFKRIQEYIQRVKTWPHR
jgi:hypothetical protein